MRALTCLLFVALSFTAVRAEAIAPIDTIESFFSWALVRRPSGLPSPQERVQLAKWLAPELLTLLDDARITQGRCIRVAPRGDKPNLLEGDLFAGNDEGATEAAYQGSKQDHGKTVVAVDLIFIDKRRPRGERRRTLVWRAEVALVMIDRRWYVQDIRFDLDRSLRTTLQEYIEDGARECNAR